ncbi:tRNA nucleotidyltransferase/poly(A) polymerase [Pararheinheimera phage vB_PsoM_KLER1-1]|nr:tRNA nucleotidyltransferase/poly(A) polymerase [Pararheinheimera phage vB_PsoM_KLER1-1]
MKPTFARDMALKVLATLNSAGIEAICAGGCPRDIFYCQQVNDIDIAVRCDENFEKICELVSGFIAEFTDDYSVEVFSEYGEADNLVGDNEGEDLDVSSDFRERIDWVAKFHVSTEEDDFYIDILGAKNMAEEDPLTNFVSTFDFSINQFWMGADGLIYSMENGSSVVRTTSDLVPSERIKKRYRNLKNKYPEHNWSAVESFLNDSRK